VRVELPNFGSTITSVAGFDFDVLSELVISALEHSLVSVLSFGWLVGWGGGGRTAPITVVAGIYRLFNFIGLYATPPPSHTGGRGPTAGQAAHP
jgi:hypothetical protein